MSPNTDNMDIYQAAKVDWSEGNGSLRWCMENQDAIHALHSSLTYTKVFQKWCEGCERYYMHCMFSTKERKSDNPSCRWCNAVDYHHHEIGNFDIPLHIHCNRLGKKTCKYNLSLDPPELVVASVVKEANIADIPVVQSFVIVEKKMSQKERKRAQAKERAEAKSKA